MRTVPIIAALIYAGTAMAQPLPDIGKLMMRSKDKKYIETGCVLCFDKQDEHFECCDTGPEGTGAEIRSKYWDAAEFYLPGGSLDCTSGVCGLQINSGEMAQLDWIMPSRDAATRFVRISSRHVSSGTLSWTLDWCTYAEGAPPCTPDGSNSTSAESTGNAGVRSDAVFAFPDFDPAWCPGDHVVFVISPSNDTILEGLLWEYAPARMPLASCNATRTPTPMPTVAQCATFTPPN